MKPLEYRNDIAVEFDVYSEMIFDQLRDEYHNGTCRGPVEC